MRGHLMHASGGNKEKLPKHAPTPIFFAIDEFMEKAKASIEHLFSFHEYCDVEWCLVKQLDEKEVQLSSAHKKLMHEKVNYESVSLAS